MSVCMWSSARLREMKGVEEILICLWSSIGRCTNKLKSESFM